MSETQDVVRASTSATEIPMVALVGAPNCGKTTLYNWLTGSHAKAVNYPGSTVDFMKGSLASHWKKKAFVLDTPGTYSLHAKTEDELVTQNILQNQQEGLVPTHVVVVMDGTQLSRHLLLAEQIREKNLPMILVVTMVDILKSGNVKLNLQMLQEHFACPVVTVDGRLGAGLPELIEQFSKNVSRGATLATPEWNSAVLEEKIQWAEKMAAKVLGRKNENSHEFEDSWWKTTRSLDRIFLHPFLGLILFLLIMTTLFSSIYWMAAPLMDLIDGWTSSLAEAVVALSPESLFMDFLGNGLVASFGAVVIFVPQIFILFFGMGLLESSGYLARAATLIDRPFSALGLSGRSFVPFLSGYACAIPALMATRNISSSRERWLARFIIPLLSCSARLPVYGLLLGFIFFGKAAWIPGLVLAGIYLGSMLFSALAAGVLNKLIPQDKKSFFLMELPLYRRPLVKVILTQTWYKTKSFITRAGPVIFILTVVLWVGTTFPNHNLEESQRIQGSYLGQIGQKIEPAFEPMGLDWRAGIGLLAAFAAREVFVSTLALVYNVTEEGEGLITALQNASFADGTPVFTVASSVGLIVFFMIALQCISTVGMMIKESGSVKMALVQLVIFNLVAYILAVGLVQGLRAFGVA